MTTARQEPWWQSPSAVVERFFSGFAFPALTLMTLGLFTLLLAGLLLVPPTPDALGGFADQFRVWCFGYDPKTGSVRWGFVLATFSELLLFMGIVFVLWRQPLRAQARRRVAAFVPAGVGAAVLVAALGIGFALLADGKAPVDPTVFPAKALRTSLEPPRFTLTDQDGTKVSLDSLRGRVVLVTAVYASCGLACPRILGQVKGAVATLSAEEKQGLSVLGITLDPERDDQAKLARMAKAQKVEAPLYHLLTGTPDAVNAALDRFDVSRRKDPESGVIEHANVFIVIDRSGRVAYHFTLDPLQEQWLGQALHLLLAEPGELARHEG
jgi:protein SCO1/2